MASKLILLRRVSSSSVLIHLFKYNRSKQYSNSAKTVTPVLSWKTLSAFRDKLSIVNVPEPQHLEETSPRLTYHNLFQRASSLAMSINNKINTTKIEGDQEHIAFLCPNNYNYAIILLGCWLSGCAAVPLCKSHPLPQLEYFIKDSSASLILGTEEYSDQVQQLSTKYDIPCLIFSSSEDTNVEWENQFNEVASTNRALILYTSGTTGSPKGVVLTHGNLRAQVDDISEAWGMTSKHVLLHCLPLHHLHGVLNALLTPLSVGGSVLMMPKFDANQVWQQITNITEDISARVNTFMGVPTMYVKLLEEFDSKYKGKNVTEEFIRKTCKDIIRLMVSGSAALPETIFERWEAITGHRLLERFGMTEIGMGLTNPLKGPRKPGFVGNPFPQVRVRLVKPTVKGAYDVIAIGTESKTDVTAGMEKESGELQIQGPTVFHEYWNKPEATKSAFTSDGWFKTGDIAQYVDGSYKILGRASVDIIKSGGFKISALEVENQLLCHEEIAECAVVGIEDITWGQKIAAVIVLKTKDSKLNSEKIRTWAKERLPYYSVPSVVSIVESIPRSPIGKVNKKDLVKQMFPLKY